MKRFIRYLYEWEQGKKHRNVGFVKIMQSTDNTEIAIHGKGFDVNRNEKLSVWMLLERDESIFGISLGLELCTKPSLNSNFEYTPELIGGQENYENICGIMLKGTSGQNYIALWDENMGDEFDPDCVQEYVEAKENVIQPESPDESIMRHGSMRKDTAQSSIMQEYVEDDVEDVEYVEEDSEEDVKGVRKEVCAQSSAELQDLPKYNITKIQRKEISILPRSEWRLANNNFLLHGYYNYRHLVLIDDGELLRLGVPGIYHEKEARAAATFGFPEFIGENDTGIVLSPEEHNIEQQFGYWCREVRRK